MLTKLNILLVVLFSSMSSATSDFMLDLAESEDVPIECHHVVTKDGYILGLYHLPTENNKTHEKEQKIIFLMHALISSSPMYIFYPQRSAGYYFRNLGYDVWMGNARGNTFSRNHTTLSPDDPQFWQFSWHEIGIYDLPAMIDYILTKTGQDQLIYVGYSQGVTTAFVMLSERPEYNDKISILHAMAPPIILKYNNPIVPASMIKRINEDDRKLEDWVKKTNNYELFRHDDYAKVAQLSGEFCKMTMFTLFCKYLIDVIFGPILPHSYNERLMSDFATYIPSGSGYRQFMHFAQLANSGRFQKFDFGSAENLKMYGSSTPPEYNTANIKTKIHLMYGTHDYVVPQKNIPILIEKIRPSIFATNKMNLFNHMDFGIQVQNVNQLISNVTNQFFKLT